MTNASRRIQEKLGSLLSNVTKHLEKAGDNVYIYLKAGDYVIIFIEFNSDFNGTVCSKTIERFLAMQIPPNLNHWIHYFPATGYITFTTRVPITCMPTATPPPPYILNTRASQGCDGSSILYRLHTDDSRSNE